MAVGRVPIDQVGFEEGALMIEIESRHGSPNSADVLPVSRQAENLLGNGLARPADLRAAEFGMGVELHIAACIGQAARQVAEFVLAPEHGFGHVREERRARAVAPA